MTDGADGRPTRPTLNRDYILRTALAVIDRDGLDGLTMRRLGTELGVDPMAVYRYVPNKGALLDGVSEILWRDGLDIDAVDPGAGWRALLETAMSGFRAVLIQHPRAMAIVATHPLVTDEQFVFLEVALARLEAAGLPVGPKVLALLNVLGTFTTGHTLAEAAEPVGGEGGTYDPERIASLAERFPRLVRLLAEPDGGHDMTEEFRMGLAAILDGWPA